jgi:hypothetical protein
MEESEAWSYEPEADPYNGELTEAENAMVADCSSWLKGKEGGKKQKQKRKGKKNC